ncbi:MAG: two-component system, NarL family, nitrate/nitrite response regulator NarL [Micromonosporaceae bacterium]|jgi:DNA-binding NarL/FixJ family response regulator|nr:two-component system, NarL family, nitrate/nitrite response regulator NarL [Micromonosporaceae bacterium]MDT5038648.1 two-component system, NarL family, nitrate/nitrite response regulator NarL [Micromonosporaceae bacterium]
MTETVRPTIRLAVQSSRRLMRDALAGCLGAVPGLVVVGHTAGIDDLHRLCLLRRPDVIVVDAGPLSADVVDALRPVRSAIPTVEIIIVYTELTGPALQAAIRARLTRLVPAAQGLEGLVRAVRQLSGPAGRAVPDGLALTDREMEILLLLSTGHSVPGIATLLEISPNTVENHKRRLYTKLAVGNQAHAASRAVSLGLTVPTVPARPPPLAPTATERTGEDGRDPLVVLSGPPGPTLDEVAQTLLAGAITVARSRYDAMPPGEQPWATWNRGPLITVLVDPRSVDWSFAAAAGSPVVVVHTAGATGADVTYALGRGARAVLRCDQVRTDLTALLSLVGRGYLALAAEHLTNLPGDVRRGLGGGAAGPPELTARERQILHSIADGHTVRQTARVLGIAAKTVENTQARLFRKLGVRNRSGALNAAYHLGLVDPTIDPTLAGNRVP